MIMKEIMLAVLAATSLLLPACSGTTDNNVKLTNNDNGKVCKMEKPLALRLFTRYVEAQLK